MPSILSILPIILLICCVAIGSRNNKVYYKELLKRKQEQEQKQKEQEQKQKKEEEQKKEKIRQGFTLLQMGSSYQEVKKMIGFDGLLFSSKTGKGIEVRSKNMICPNCGATYNTADDLICPSCGALNIKDTAMLKDDFVQEEYVWYLNDDKTKSIKCIFKNDKLISKVQQGLY